MSNPFYSQNQQLFDRYWSTTLTPWIQSSVTQDGSQNGTPQYTLGTGKLYAPDDNGMNLKTTFDFKVTSDLQSAVGEVAIWNLSPDTRQWFEKGMQLILKAGYYGLAKNILICDVIGGNIKVERRGPDVISTFKVGACERQIQTSLINKSYPPGINLFSLIGDCAAALGADSSAIYGITDYNYNTGVTLHGAVKDELQRLCRDASSRQKMQIKAYVVGNDLIIRPANYSSQSIAILLSTGYAGSNLKGSIGPNIPQLGNTGLIGTPYFAVNGNLNCTALLNPDLQPGQLIQVQSESVNGLFIIQDVTFRGDSHGTSAESWVAELNAYPQNQPLNTPNLVNEL